MFSRLQPTTTIKIKWHFYEGSENILLLEFKPLVWEGSEAGSWQQHCCTDKLGGTGCARRRQSQSCPAPLPAAPPTTGGLEGSWLSARGDMPGGALLSGQALMSRVPWAPKADHAHIFTSVLTVLRSATTPSTLCLPDPPLLVLFFTQTHCHNQAQEMQQESFVLTSCSLFYQCMKTEFLILPLYSETRLHWAMAVVSTHDSNACFLLFQYEHTHFKKECKPHKATCFVPNACSDVPVLGHLCHVSIRLYFRAWVGLLAWSTGAEDPVITLYILMPLLHIRQGPVVIDSGNISYCLVLSERGLMCHEISLQRKPNNRLLLPARTSRFVSKAYVWPGLKYLEGCICRFRPKLTCKPGLYLKQDLGHPQF